MALLHNEGRLDWTKPVRDYIPEFRLHDPVASERVTVQDLLCHQSGLPRHDWVHLPGDRSAAELLGVMRYLELSRDIRAAYQYNNLCYNVAGLLIERLSGQSYEAFMRARLTDRLGMKFSFTLDDLEASADAARPYMMHEDTRLPALRLPIRTIAAGAINTSVADIASWMRLHLGKGEFDGERLLPAALIGELHAPRIYNTSPGHAEFGEAHYGLGFRSTSYRGDRLVFHGGGWIGWGTLMTLVPDFGIGVAVFTNRSPSEVPATLTWYIIDRLRGRDPVDWRERFRKQREEFVAHLQADKDAREKARHKDTHPAHELADYAGDYEHPAYGVMSIKERGGALHWSWRGMFATMAHRHYETFELPEVPDRLLPDKLAITFLTNRDGNIVSLSAPLEPMVKDIVFVRLAAGDCTLRSVPRTVRRQFQEWRDDTSCDAGYGRPACAEARQSASLSPCASARPKVPHRGTGGLLRRISRRRDDHRRTDLSSTERHVRRKARGRIGPVPAYLTGLAPTHRIVKRHSTSPAVSRKSASEPPRVTLVPAAGAATIPA